MIQLCTLVHVNNPESLNVTTIEVTSNCTNNVFLTIPIKDINRTMEISLNAEQLLEFLIRTSPAMIGKTVPVHPITGEKV